MRYLLIVAAVVLTGCQTKQVEEMSYSERKELAGKIVDRCNAQGVKPGTSEMEVCSRAEVEREIATRRNNAARRERRVRVTAYCQNFSGNVVCF